MQRQEDAARERKEAAERAAKERAEREERARILAARRKAYDGWEKALTAGFEQRDKLQRLRQYVDALEAANDSDEVRQFVRWARGYVEVPEIPSSEYMPANVQSSRDWMCEV